MYESESAALFDVAAPSLAAVADEFALGEPVDVTAVARGAMGRIWRARTSSGLWAIKDFLWDPDPAAVEDEIRLAAAARDAGIELPMSRPSVAGRYVAAVPRSDGNASASVRVYEWTPGVHLPHPPSMREIADAARMLATLHAVAPPTSRAAHPWYAVVPTPEEWQEIGMLAWERSRALGGAVRAAMRTVIPATSIVTAARPSFSVVCHLDFTPANMFRTPRRTLALLDWDDAGAGDPTREFASAALAWSHGFSDAEDSDAAVRAFGEAYVELRGTASAKDLSIFSAAIADSLNYLAAQTRLASDPAASDTERARGESEALSAATRIPRVDMLEHALELLVRD